MTSLTPEEVTMNISVRGFGLAVALALGVTWTAASAAPSTNTTLTGTGYSVGDTAYDFTAPDQNGVTTTLYSHHGPFIILTFTAAWCAPCVAEEATVAQAIADLEEGFGFPVLLQLPMLVQDIDESVSDAKGAAAWAIGFKLPSVYHCNGDPTGAVCAQFNSYGSLLGPTAFPVTVVISPRMKILYVTLGESFSAADLELIVENDLKSDMADGQAILHPEIANLIPLVANTPLDPKLAKLLSKDVRGALAAFDNSKPQEAIHKLELFDRRLERLVSGGSTMWSCPEAAPIVQPLIDRANNIISALGKLPSQ
jgi:peroxiredoxin